MMRLALALCLALLSAVGPAQAQVRKEGGTDTAEADVQATFEFAEIEVGR